MSAKIVALDGPAGAGKSSVSKALAKKLGFSLLDTGALYRAVAFAAKTANIAWNNEGLVGELALRLAERGEVRLMPEGDGLTVWVGEQNVTDLIRTPDIAQGASQVSALPSVREALLPAQRALVQRGVSLVAEGRDMGTVVFPDAHVKFFVTASCEVRAHRRFAELTQKGVVTTWKKTLEEIVLRDRADTERAIAPLRQAPDAILVDTSTLTIEAVIAHCFKLAEEGLMR